MRHRRLLAEETTAFERVDRRSDAMRAGGPIRRYNVVMSAAHDSLLYARVETVLAGEITDGDLKVGDQLPTEDSLIARFGVSRITVRRAIQNLVSRGLVEIRRGKGTFVAAPKIMQDLKELSGFVEDMHVLGRKPTARLIGKEIVTANATVARQLALTRGERVVRIRRVRLADGVPLSFDETYLPLEIGKKIITNNLKIEPIFSLLERKYDVPLIEAEYKLDAVAAENEVASSLKVKPGSPIFRIEGTSSTSSRPIDYETLYYRGGSRPIRHTPCPKNFSLKNFWRHIRRGAEEPL